MAAAAEAPYCYICQANAVGYVMDLPVCGACFIDIRSWIDRERENRVRRAAERILSHLQLPTQPDPSPILTYDVFVGEPRDPPPVPFIAPADPILN